MTSGKPELDFLRIKGKWIQSPSIYVTPIDAKIAHVLRKIALPQKISKNTLVNFSC